MRRINQTNRGALVIVSALMVVIISAGMVLAQGPGKGKGRSGNCDGPAGRGPEMRLERMAARLDLSVEQKEAVEAIHEKNREKNVELRKQMLRLKNELQGEMLKDEPSEKTVLSLNEKMGKIKTELKANRLQTRLAVRELLTPEQRDRMLMMGQHGRGGGRQGGGPGKHHFRAPRGDRRGPGCDQGPCGSGRGMGRGMGKGDGTGPRAGSDCPQAQQPDDTADDQ
jgi:Spy/CpxP family protein refolding chaperone